MDGFTCNLKTYRVLKRLTQGELAEIVGVRRETIMRLEKAQYNPVTARLSGFAVTSFFGRKFPNLSITLHKAHPLASWNVAQNDACFFGKINYNQRKLPEDASAGSRGKTYSNFFL